MKRKLSVYLATIATLLIGYQGFTNSGGAPQNRSGSPASNGNTCSTGGCHSGPAATNQSVTVSSTIPASGYQANTNYTITISVDNGTTMGSTVGFSASVEDASGHVGTISSPGSGAQLSGSNFVTHTISGNFASGGSRTWTFNWNPGANPPANATVYVAANFANGTGGTAGDVIVSNSASFSQAVSVPMYTISQINSLDANFAPDSLGVNCALTGTVFTDDFDGNNGYSFYMYDNTGEINVFDFVDEPGGYQVSRGDSIRVYGDIAFFNGLLEIQVDSIQLLASNIALRAPRVVSTLDETTESDYIRVNNFSVVTPSQWPSAGSSANVDITNGTDTLTMRIDSDTDIDGSPVPTGSFDVIGAGGQFDSSAPHDEGYQIFPRDLNDILPAAISFNGVPLYNVNQINSLDANFAPDSLGVNCAVQGVVFTDDFDGNNGYSFYLYDNTDGINIFDFVDEPGGYQVSRGDSIRVFGDVAFFNGLLELQVDSIQVLATGVALKSPAVVSTLDESTESEYIRVNGFELVNPAQWPSAGSSANVDITNGVDTLTMRIDSDTDIDGSPAPTGFFDVIGAGGQFDGSAPHDEGYQILPRDTNDIIPAIMAVPCAAPFFSEYIEGSSQNKGFEVYNPTSGNLDLGPYKVYLSVNGGSSMSEFNLMGTLASGDVYTIVTDQADPSMLAVADTNLSFPSVAHFNGDDALFLVDTVMGDTLDIVGVVGVDPGSSWTVGSGSTANNTLVRMATVNAGETDWNTASTQWMVNPTNTFSFLGSHTSNCVNTTPSTPTVEFRMANYSALESAGAGAITLDINPATTGVDTVYLSFMPGPGLTTADGTITPAFDPVTGLLSLVVPAGSDSINLLTTINDDALVEGLEYGDMMILGTSAGLTTGTITSTRFEIIDNDIPTYNIAQVKGIDTDFIPDSLGVQCKLIGTVFTDDFDGNNGYSFYMYDNTGAINIFNFVDEPGGYQVQRGDSIRAIGHVEFYNGLIELQVDSIALISSGVSLRQPTQVFDLNENTESDFIRLNGYYLVDPSTWPVFAGSSVNMEITNGQDTLVMRIDSDTDIDGTQPPLGYFDVIGAGGQFDASAPHDENYQIFPRDTMDIIPVDLPQVYISEVMPSSSLSAPIDGDWFEIRNMGNTTVDLNGFSWDDESRNAGNHTVTTSVQVPAGGSALFVDVATADVSAWETEWKQNGQGLIILNEGDEFDNGFSGLSSSGDEVNLYDDGGRLVSAVAYDGASVSSGVSLEFNMNGMFTGAAVDGVNGAYTSTSGDVGSPGNQSAIGLDELIATEITLYPNPSNGVFRVETGSTEETGIQIIDLNGALIYSVISTDPAVQIDLSNLAAGVYLVKVNTGSEEVIRKMVLR
jgi:hypothetical protein